LNYICTMNWGLVLLYKLDANLGKSYMN
jgi:hypothetical protein